MEQKKLLPEIMLHTFSILMAPDYPAPRYSMREVEGDDPLSLLMITMDSTLGVMRYMARETGRTDEELTEMLSGWAEARLALELDGLFGMET